MDTNPFKRMIDLTRFEQRFKTNSPRNSPNFLRNFKSNRKPVSILTSYQQLMLDNAMGIEWLYSVERNVKDQWGETGLLYNGWYENDVQLTLVWFNELSIYGKESKINWTRGSYEKKIGPLYKQQFFCSMSSVCEYPEHVPILYFFNIVNVFVLFVHLLITINIYARLPITVNIAVLNYSATPCSICTVESDRNIKSFSNIFCPQFFSSKCLIQPFGENKKSFFFGIGIFAMRFCKNCSLSFVPKLCRNVENSEKDVASVNNGRSYNLVFLDIVK